MIKVVSAIILVQDLGFLFIKRKNQPKNKYALPGGHVEKNEKWDEALSREIFEEIFLETTPDDFIKYNTIFTSKYEIIYGLLCKTICLSEIKFRKNSEVSKIKISEETPVNYAFKTDKFIIKKITHNKKYNIIKK